MMAVVDVFARVLVAVDGSEPSEAGVRLALRIVAAPDGCIRFVSVCEPAAPDDTVYREALARAMEAARAATAEASTALRSGRPVDEIVTEADGWDATCIAIGTHGRRGLSRTLLGSCAEGVLRRSTLPVLIVHGAQPEVRSLDRVLCAFDGSNAAQRAFEAAAAFAAGRDAEVHLLAVVPIDNLYATGYEQDGFDPDGSIGELYDEARRRLKSVAAGTIGRGVRVALHVVGGADVAAIIAGCAVQYGCGLVILGTHGRRGLARAALGSTAEGVIRNGTVPVLACREHLGAQRRERSAADARRR